MFQSSQQSVQKEPTYVATPAEAEAAINEISKYEITGLDTEFEGVRIGEESCVGKARVHVCSVATPSGPLLPTGVNQATSYVFAHTALSVPSVKGWLEDDRYLKAVHNQPVDSHALRNAEVRLRGGVNTLAMARWWWPHRAKFEGFDLDSLARDFLSSAKTEDFDELLGYDDHELVRVIAERKFCSCQSPGCRKRTPPDLHVKTPKEVEVEVKKKVRRHISLFSLYPGHILWDRYLNYAAWDAVLALWLYQYMIREGKKERPYPWLISL